VTAPAATSRSRRIPEPFLAAVKDKARIIDIVADYVELRPAGAGQVKGLCPFHSEKTASFNVRPDVNRYHCFGCGVGGDSIAFLMEIERLTFHEAVLELAARCGLQLPDAESDDETAENERAAQLSKALGAASTPLQRWLQTPGAHDAVTFLQERGFTTTHAQHWGLGYNPNDGRALSDALLSAGISVDEQIAAGLAGRSKSGRLYDTYRGRLIWPLHDPRGKLVGYAGRDLVGDSQSKYINTKSTDLYHKGSTLFGFTQARAAIMRTRQVYIVEGYTDVMAMVAASFVNTVATSGTTFTAEQAALLLARLGDGGEVVTAFDNDAAGRGAAWKVFNECQHFTSNITAVDFSSYGGKADPCDVRANSGDEALQHLVSAKRPVLEMLLRADVNTCDLGTPEGKVAAAEAVSARISQVKSDILRREYRRITAEWIGVADADIKVAHSPTRAESCGGPERSAPPTAHPTVGAGDADLQLAALLIVDPRYIQSAVDYADCDLADLLGRSVAEIVELSTGAFPGGRPTADPDATLWIDFMHDVVAAEDQELLWRLVFTPAAQEEDAEELVTRVCTRRLRSLRAELNSRLPSADAAEQVPLLTEIAQLNRRLRHLR
jgi:DNA primase